MILLELAQEVGLRPFKAAGTNGGEYKSACPDCGGKDRFFIQPNRQMKKCAGYYCCRQCQKSGDAIQFAIDFMGMNFKQAVERLGVELDKRGSMSYEPIGSQKKLQALVLKPISDDWQTKAAKFVDWASNNISDHPEILEWLSKRGLSIEVVRANKIGWCPQDIQRDGSDWGLSDLDGGSKSIWIPKGIVISTFDGSGKILQIKVRRSEWNVGDTVGKYIVVSGGMNAFSIVGDTNKPLMVAVESEFDAYALHHKLKGHAFVVAVGGSTKRPDNVIDYLASRRDLLICHDNDEGGLAMFRVWGKWYSHARPYPTPCGKDVGEAIEQGLSIKAWVLSYKWAKSEHLELMQGTLKYIYDNKSSGLAFDNLERDIIKGPNSSKARSGELLNDVELLREALHF